MRRPQAGAGPLLTGARGLLRWLRVRPGHHVGHDLGRLLEHHVGGLVLGLVELLDALQRRQILRRPAAVLPRQALALDPGARSEERRVGKSWRSAWVWASLTAEH